MRLMVALLCAWVLSGCLTTVGQRQREFETTAQNHSEAVARFNASVQAFNARFATAKRHPRWEPVKSSAEALSSRYIVETDPAAQQQLVAAFIDSLGDEDQKVLSLALVQEQHGVTQERRRLDVDADALLRRRADLARRHELMKAYAAQPIVNIDRPAPFSPPGWAPPSVFIPRSVFCTTTRHGAFSQTICN